MAIIRVANQTAFQAALSNGSPGDYIIVERLDASGPSNIFDVAVNDLTIESQLTQDDNNDIYLRFLANAQSIALIGPGNFRVEANEKENSISAGGGNDFIEGGLGNDVLVGGNGNDVLDRESRGDLPSNDLLIGGQGDDKYWVDSIFDQVLENSGEGVDEILIEASLTSTNRYILPANVERLNYFGSDSFIGIGSELNNVISGFTAGDNLIGGAGDDILVGTTFLQGSGNTPDTFDTLEGGLGNDLYEVDILEDIVLEKPGEGQDIIRVQPFGQDFTTYTLSESSNSGLAYIENLIFGGILPDQANDDYSPFTLIGNSLDNEIVGANGRDIIYGLHGNDRLIGGNGNDSLRGGLGDDYYDVDSTGDDVSEGDDAAIDPRRPGQVGGRDTIATSLAEFSLGDPSKSGLLNTENLTATRAFDGNSYGADFSRNFNGNQLDNEIVGGDKNDTLSGGNGNDYLIGGFGFDQLTGGNGNDDYEIDSIGDKIVENNNPRDGHDTISTSLLAFSLVGTAENPGLGNVEDLIFQGALILKDLGDPNADRPRNVDFDRSVKFIGTGNERDNAIIGADGNDLLSGVLGNDVLVGLAGQDTLDGGDGLDELYGLGGNDTLAGGAGPDILYGGADNDRIIGALGNDKLFGETGSDRLFGLSGNDHLAGGNGKDSLSGGTGIDRLFGEAGDDTLNGGSSNDRLFGQAGKDNLQGGSGNDWIYGGASSDTLRGNTGSDYFAFDTKPRSGNIDRIVDFNVRDDIIRLEDFVFRNIGARGRLSVEAFWTGSSAHDTSDRIIYNPVSGSFFYDPDGIGGAAQVKFAVLSSWLSLTNSEFAIV